MKVVIASLLIALLAAFQVTPAHADERILDYHSDIHIAADGSMTVAEHIRVRAAGDRIKRGIYRDFPTDYRDRARNRYKVGLTVLGANHDGQPEHWHSERRGNGVRIYLGDKNTNVSPGEHTYAIKYRTTRQLGFFKTHDELYWNVTGTGWAYPIDDASASVHLPANVAAGDLKASGYTGSKGSAAQNLTTDIIADGANFATTQALGPEQNLTVVLEFPKGIVTEPSNSQKAASLLGDNRGLLLALLGLALLWLYYVWAWNRYGRDPASGPLVARYDPPDGDTAAALR